MFLIRKKNLPRAKRNKARSREIIANRLKIKWSMIPNILLRLAEIVFHLAEMYCSQAQSKNLTSWLASRKIISKTTKIMILTCLESLPNAIILSLMLSMNMSSRLGAMIGSNILKKSDSKLERNKELRLKWLWRFHLWNKLIISRECCKCNWKVYNQYACLSLQNVKFLKFFVSKTSTKPTNNAQWSKCLPKRTR